MAERPACPSFGHYKLNLCLSCDRLSRKYATFTPSYAFAPICIETLGAWGDSTKDLVRKIGATVREKTGEPRSASFLIQHPVRKPSGSTGTRKIGNPSSTCTIKI